MGYFERERKRAAAEKMTKQVMTHPRFKEAMQKHEEEAILNALARFTFIFLGFLETRYNYKEKGLRKAIEYVRMNLRAIESDLEFFATYYQYYKDEYGIDVLKELGLEVVDE